MFTCVSWASVNGVTCGTWTGMWNAGTPLKGITGGGAINGTVTGMLTGVITGRPMGGALTGTAAGPGEGWWSWPWPAIEIVMTLRWCYEKITVLKFYIPLFYVVTYWWYEYQIIIALLMSFLDIWACICTAYTTILQQRIIQLNKQCNC